jgi:hypothetical protein
MLLNNGFSAEWSLSEINKIYLQKRLNNQNV